MNNKKISVSTHDRQTLLNDFSRNAAIYESIISASLSILNRVLHHKIVLTVTSRLKNFDSFYEKSNRLSGDNLRYADPLTQINDIIGIRIVVIAQRNIADVCESIRDSFEIIEEEDKAAELLKTGQLGYESYHLICRLGDNRSNLNEYIGLCDRPFEIQVRTALQHAWAENEHRIQYKKTKNPELQKRFLRLAAAISSADEEFDRIYEINERLEANAKAAEAEGTEYVTEADPGPVAENDADLSQISLLFGKKPSELIAERRLAEAIQVYDRFIKLQPNQITHYVGRAKARALAGDIEGGEADLHVAKTKAPEHPATKALQKFFIRLLRDVENGAISEDLN